jgi:hypothetical protein
MNLRVCNIVAAVCLLTAAMLAQGAPAKPAAPDYSGRYSFLQDGEDVQLNQTGTHVDGYITRFGSTDADEGTVLEQTFAKATLEGDKLSFTTKPIHATWYEFTGTIGRGPAKTRAEDGYYQIVGTLTEHTQKNGKDIASRTRQVTFKLFADESDDAAPPKR